MADVFRLYTKRKNNERRNKTLIFLPMLCTFLPNLKTYIKMYGIIVITFFTKMFIYGSSRKKMYKHYNSNSMVCDYIRT